MRIQSLASDSMVNGYGFVRSAEFGRDVATGNYLNLDQWGRDHLGAECYRECLYFVPESLVEEVRSLFDQGLSSPVDPDHWESGWTYLDHMIPEFRAMGRTGNRFAVAEA